ncbi:hypothetical protein ACO0QE_003661 [Hanseniaspora vineae]
MIYNKEKLRELYCKYLKDKNANFEYQYGTAGFRYNHTLLDPVMFTTSIIAGLRSLTLDGKAIGVMITASHNPPQDNGVKIVEPMGEMLIESWEMHSTQLANSLQTFEIFEKNLCDIIDVTVQKTIVEKNLIKDNLKLNIVLGKDSRASSDRLSEIVYATITSVFSNLKVKVKDLGLVTTPQLHYLTRYANKTNVDIASLSLQATYFPHFKNAFTDLLKLHYENIDPKQVHDYLSHFPFGRLVIDCANGVGSYQFDQMIKDDPWFRSFVEIINDKYLVPSSLNVNCGADYVKTNQRLPENVDGLLPQTQGDSLFNLYCSFDGDADRVVFYYLKQLEPQQFDDPHEKQQFHLLDGDKISTMLAKFFHDMLTQAKIPQDELRLGVVQTAYANGSSTLYLKNSLKIPASCTKTGVKHLHHEAVSEYDVGVYFEANGHGTVIFSPKVYEVVEARLESLHKSSTKHEYEQEQEQIIALKTLKLFTELINQSVGDAISDMLSVIAVLIISQQNAEDWNKEYKDLPNRLIKVIVDDRTVFKTTNAERQLVSPPGLQKKIDEIVAKYGPLARSFVRASGTEDAVRVYAEADSTEKVEALVAEVGALVKSSSS